ncbi:MAG TPA: LapA family protein [Candidatus Paceibacterota bacterium]|nr:LapA family protein [Candidatus Paceibacterota bacterium]
MVILSLFIGLIIGGATVIFAIENTATMTVSFLTWHITAPTAFFVIASFAVGLTAAFLSLLPRLIAQEYEMRVVRREKRAIEGVAKSQSQTQEIPVVERAYA